MPFFDINQPIRGGVNTIDSLIESYGSPEAARSNFQENPNANDYITSQYQKQTGDYFADPFKDAEKRRDAELMSTIAGGRTIGPNGTPLSTVSTASGSNLGPSIIGISPSSPLRQGPQPQQQQFQGMNGSGQQPQTPNYFDMAMVKNPLPTVDSTDTQTQGPSKFDFSQRRRVAELGNLGVSLYQSLKKSNPEALAPTDQNKQELELDPSGKPIAGKVLNLKLYNDPRFQKLLQTNPEAAHKFYRAAYGRDLQQDITMQAAHEASVNKSDREVLDQFKKSGDFDPITGDPFIRQMVPDKFDPTVQNEVKRPLSFFEKKVLEKSGAFENVTGQKRPEGMDVTATGANTPEEKKAIRMEIAKQQAAHPGEPIQKSMLRARSVLASSASATGDTNDPRPWYLKTADTAGQLGAGAVNAGPIDTLNMGLRGANSLFYGIPRVLGANLPYAPQVPHLPVPTNQNLINRFQNDQNDIPALGDIASETADYWQRKYPSLSRF